MDAGEQTYEQEQLSAQERLWRFATAAYAVPAVAKACIAAQEKWAADVNLMLYLSWCAREGRQLSADDIRTAQERCRPWREQVILPLRRQRVAWRGQDACAAEYVAIKQLELQAERAQLDFLATLFERNAVAEAAQKPDPHSASGLLREHLQSLATHCGVDKDVFEPFYRALGSV